MNDPNRSANSERVLVLAPTVKDAALSRTLLTEARLACHISPDLDGLCREIGAGVGAILLTEEVLADGDADGLVDVLRQQPAWSDVPILLLCASGADSPVAVWAMELLGNVTTLERPVRVTTLVSALRTALKARWRQYELRNQMEALNEANCRKDEFLAMLAHELRNPLAPVRNGIEILRLARKTDGNGKLMEQTIGIMDKQIHHITRLVDDLLDVSRITRGKIELRKEKVDLATAVSRAVEAAHPLIASHHHTLTVNLPPEAVHLEADPTRLEQVLVNLLNNAAKYTGDGGDIRLTTERDNGHVLIRVRDTGMGIPPELLPKVFDLFIQAERTLDRSQGGLGIGLTLAKKLVEIHDGTIEAYSEGSGKGSEFVVRLPALPSEPPTRTLPPEEEAARWKSGLRVLVVEDAEEAAQMLKMLLEIWGHDVRVVHDGPAALVAFRTYQPNVILLDIGLPGMNGYEVARQLCREQGRKKTSVVALTGYGGQEHKRRSLEAGCDDHLTKPPNPAALEKLLNRLLESATTSRH